MGKVVVENGLVLVVESELGVMESRPVVVKSELEVVEESELVGVVKESEPAVGVVEEVVKEQF